MFGGRGGIFIIAFIILVVDYMLITGLGEQYNYRHGHNGSSHGCPDNHWVNVDKETCEPCNCSPHGSLSLQCDRYTGYCNCKERIIGIRCDECSAGTNDVIPNCEKCNPCADRWSKIVSSLEKEFLDIQERLKSNPYGYRNLNHAFNVRNLKTSNSILNQIKTNLMDIIVSSDQYKEKVHDASDMKEGIANEEDIDLLMKQLHESTVKLKQNMRKAIKMAVLKAFHDTTISYRRSNKVQKEIAESLKKKAALEAKRRENIRNEAIQIIKHSRHTENALHVSIQATSTAFNGSSEVKHRMERLVNSTKSLSMRVKNYIEEVFYHPTLLQRLIGKIIKTKMTILYKDFVQINKELVDSVLLIAFNPETVKKLISDTSSRYIAHQLKKEAEIIDKRGKKVLLKYDEIERMKNSTVKAMEYTRRRMNQVQNVLSQVYSKERNMRVVMQTIGDIEKLADYQKGISKRLKANRQRLIVTEVVLSNKRQSFKKIKMLADDVNNAKTKIEKLRSSAPSLKVRLKNLDDRAVSLFEKALTKVSILTELKTNYSKNVRRIEIISADVEDLKKRAKSAHGMIVSLTKCHSNCNPLLQNGLCRGDIGKKYI